MASKQTKKIPEAARKAFARELQGLIDRKYEGNQTAAGKSLGITQGHISALLSGERGPGLNVLIMMRLETGKSIDEILGYAAAPDAELAAALVTTDEVQAGRLAAELREMRKQMAEQTKQIEALSRRKETPSDDEDPAKKTGAHARAAAGERMRK